MITLTPNSTSLDVSHVKDILALVADPAAAKARLDELVAAEHGAKTSTEAAARLTADLEAKVKEHEKNEQDLATKLAAFNETNKARTAYLNDLEASLAEREKALDLREKETFRKITERETELSTKHDSINARESAVAKMEKDIGAIRADLHRRLELIKSAALGS